ncbi:hypothetical protein [Roseateles chitosanitabidus]|uniref:hypothetical protein n=1 Tax=Roseateles chitosanitabidus TaxID=65048 RepID=UPI000836F609|nr:hypothetical protein [Roseateles chitosanitabidus]
MAKASSIRSSKDQELEWRTESDMRTLMEAEEIKRDPERLKRAAALAKEKVVELASVAGKADSGKA